MFFSHNNLFHHSLQHMPQGNRYTHFLGNKPFYSNIHNDKMIFFQIRMNNTSLPKYKDYLNKIACTHKDSLQVNFVIVNNQRIIIIFDDHFSQISQVYTSILMSCQIHIVVFHSSEACEEKDQSVDCFGCCCLIIYWLFHFFFSFAIADSCR